METPIWGLIAGFLRSFLCFDVAAVLSVTWLGGSKMALFQRINLWIKVLLGCNLTKD